MTASVLMIGGTSHVGKSSFAARMGSLLGWNVVSTDKMGRHPGRPWPKVPAAVAEFYDTLSDETIYWFLRVHHQNMAVGLIDLACQNRPLVMEGSALRPEVMVSVRVLCAVVLWAPADVITARVYQGSGYAALPLVRQARIDAFLRRSLTDNAALKEEARDCGVPVVDVSDNAALDQLSAEWGAVVGG